MSPSRPTTSDSEDDKLISYECQTTTIGDFSNYDNHLQNVLYVVDNITSNAPKKDGFKMATYSELSDPVYGLAQCRGDVKGENCSTCLNDAAIFMSNNCPNLTMTAMVIRSKCFLMYSNQSFFRQPYGSTAYPYCDSDLSDDSDIRDTAESLSKSLIANLNATTMFGKGVNRTENFKNFVQVMVECRRDLTTDYCTGCLTNSTRKLLINCSEAWVGRYYNASNCNVRYEIRIPTK